MAPEPGTVSWRELWAEAERRLAHLPPAEARWIVEEAAGLEGALLTVALSEPVTENQMAAFDRMLGRREAGEPLQYVVGHWSFRTLDLAVDRRALIPRPETEFLVDVALEHVDRIALATRDRPIVVLDLGTGTGAVAFSIAVERVGTSVWATDRSPDALALARANLAGLGRPATRVRLAEGSWFDALDPALAAGIDVIVSNPPYVADGDPLPDEVRDWEPASALLSGADGLDDLRVLVASAPAWLAPGGALVVELDPAQAATVAELMTAASLVDVAIRQDLTGRDRVVEGRRT